jgi:hypothetical protein
MASDIDEDPPVSHAIADGWAEFAERVLPSIHGTKHAQAHGAFHFGAMYVLQLTQQVIADSSGEAVSLALKMLNAELDQFMKAHAIVVRAGFSFSDKGISGFCAGHECERRSEVHEEAKTEPLGGVQGPCGPGGDSG